MNREIVRFLSPARLERYSLPGDSCELAYDRYQWNLQLSASMIPLLEYVEIGLRNHLDTLIGEHYGKDWLLSPPKALRLRQNDLDKIRSIVNETRYDRKKVLTNDDIVSRMNFGFWCSFFQKQYDPVLWHLPKAMAVVFPHLSRNNRARQQIFPKLQLARFARNSVAHHEPIWNMSPTIKIIHDTCWEIVCGMSGFVAEGLAKIDRFDEIYDQGTNFLKGTENNNAAKVFDPTRL